MMFFSRMLNVTLSFFVVAVLLSLVLVLSVRSLLISLLIKREPPVLIV